LALMCASVRRYCGAAELDGAVLGAPAAGGKGGRSGAGAAGASPSPAGPIARLAGGEDAADAEASLSTSAAHLDRCRDEVSGRVAGYLPDLLLKFGGTAVGTHMVCTQLLAPLSMSVFGMGHLSKRFDDLLHQLSRLVVMHTDPVPLQALAVALRCVAGTEHAKMRDAVLQVQATTRTLCSRVLRLAATVTGDAALAAALPDAAGARARPTHAKGKRSSAAAAAAAEAAAAGDDDEDGATGAAGGAGQSSALLYALRRLAAVLTAGGSLACSNVEELALPASGSAASLTAGSTPIVYAATAVLKHGRRLHSLFASPTWESSHEDAGDEGDDPEGLAAARSPTFHPGLMHEAMAVLSALSAAALHNAATAIHDEAAVLEDGGALSASGAAALQQAVAMRELVLGQAQALMVLAHPSAAPTASRGGGRAPMGGDLAGTRRVGRPRVHIAAIPHLPLPPSPTWCADDAAANSAAYALTRESIPLHHRFYIWRARAVGFAAACAVIVQQGAQVNAGTPLLAGAGLEFVPPEAARAMEVFLTAALDADAREVVYMGGDIPGARRWWWGGGGGGRGLCAQ
jgi:hypothetical protein